MLGVEKQRNAVLEKEMPPGEILIKIWFASLPLLVAEIYVSSGIYFGLSFQESLSHFSLYDQESLKLHKSMISFLLFPYPVISPAEPVPWNGVVSAPWLSASIFLSFAEVSRGRSGDRLHNGCAPFLWGCMKLTDLCTGLLLSSVVTLSLCSRTGP